MAIVRAAPPASSLADPTSLWQATAVGRPEMSALEGERRYDVAIVGGGYTGLSTARYLAVKGLSPVVLEAGRVGWGASGRNGGVVEGKFRLAYSDIGRRFGIDAARHMHALGHEAVEHVAELIEAYGIEAADYRQEGAMRCAHNARALAGLVREADWVRDILGDRTHVTLSGPQMAEETGSASFVGGVLHRHGGTIHPLNFALGLARGLIEAGVSIFERSPVLAIRRDGASAILETIDGCVRTERVVIATDAYSELTDATRPLRRTIVPFRSAMIATEPLNQRTLAAGIPAGRSYSETRRMMRWFRRSGDRLLYGGRGAFGKTDSDAAFEALETAMRAQFPGLGAAKVTHRWSGLVALTLNSLPQVGRLDERTTYAIGYNGLGVAMASLMGRYVADLATGGRPELGLLSAQTVRSVPFYALRAPAVRLVAGWYQFLDRAGL